MWHKILFCFASFLVLASAPLVQANPPGPGSDHKPRPVARAKGISPKLYQALPPSAAVVSQQLPTAIKSNDVGGLKAPSAILQDPEPSKDPANMKLTQRPGSHGNAVVDLKVKGSTPLPPGPGPNGNGDWCGTGRVGGIRPK